MQLQGWHAERPATLLSMPLKSLIATHHRKATLIGVLRQEVKRSAGRSGFIGNSWFASHDANWIQFLTASGTGIGVPWAKQR